MNEARFQAVYEGQTALARKVYDALPLEEFWTPGQVVTEIRRKGLSVTGDTRALEWALSQLQSAHLIVKAGRDTYRRAEIVNPVVKESPKMAAAPTPVIADTTKPAPAAPAQLKTAPTKAPAYDRLIDLARDAAELSQRLAGLARDIDDALLDLDQELEAGREEVARVRQISALLKAM